MSEKSYDEDACYAFVRCKTLLRELVGFCDGSIGVDFYGGRHGVPVGWRLYVVGSAVPGARDVVQGRGATFAEAAVELEGELASRLWQQLDALERTAGSIRRALDQLASSASPADPPRDDDPASTDGGTGS